MLIWELEIPDSRLVNPWTRFSLTHGACLNLPSASLDFSRGYQRDLNACLALTARLGKNV